MIIKVVLLVFLLYIPSACKQWFSAASEPVNNTYYQALIPRTGQTTCYDSSDAVTPCSGTGQDGEHQRGTAWPSPRFIEKVNGTITDRLTGLMWLQNGGASGTLSWQQALNYCNNLTTGGYTDWRMPNVNELRSLQNCGQPNLAAWLNTQGFTGLSNNYFSSTTVAYKTEDARVIDLSAPMMNSGGKIGPLTVLAVRGGYAPPQ